MLKVDGFDAAYKLLGIVLNRFKAKLDIYSEGSSSVYHSVKCGCCPEVRELTGLGSKVSQFAVFTLFLFTLGLASKQGHNIVK